MNRKIPYDNGLILIVLGLLSFGLVMVFSSSTVMSKEIYGATTEIFTRQLLSVVIGLVLMFAAMHTDYHFFQKSRVIISLASVVTFLLIWALLSPGIHGVNRWINLGFIRFQPSEAAKLVVILMTAYFLTKRGGRLRDIKSDLLTCGVFLTTFIVLIMMEPDFGTSTSLLITVSILLYIAGLKYRYYVTLFLLALPAFYFLIIQVPYRRERIFAFLDPQADPYGSGYQILQSLVAVGSGGISGKGLAQGTQKLFFLPEPHTDFIYAVIGEELGMFGCAAVLLLFLVFLWRGVHISMRADTIFGMYLGLGIVTMIVFQALFNISVVLGLCPTKGIPLPFISVGGSSILIMSIATGVLLNISKHSRFFSGVEERIPVAGLTNSQGERHDP